LSLKLKISAFTLILRLRLSFMIQEGKIKFEVWVSHLGGALLTLSFEFQPAKLHFWGWGFRFSSKEILTLKAWHECTKPWMSYRLFWEARLLFWFYARVYLYLLNVVKMIVVHAFVKTYCKYNFDFESD
jgi:hypothetical protein